MGEERAEEEILTNTQTGRYTRGNAPDAERTTKGSAGSGNTRPSSRATAAPGVTPNPPRTPDAKAQQRAKAREDRLAERRARLEVGKEARALFVFCAAETATVYEPEFGDYQPKQPGQKPEVSDGSSYGRVPHSPELQASCDRFLRMLAQAKDIDPDAEPVNIDGEMIGGVRGCLMQRMARAEHFGKAMPPTHKQTNNPG